MDWLRIVLTLSLALSPVTLPAQGAKSNPHKKYIGSELNHYFIDNIETELAKMKDVQRAEYIMFIVRLWQLIDVELMGEHELLVSANTPAVLPNFIPDSLWSTLGYAPDAQAAWPLLYPVAIAAGNLVTAAVRTAPMAASGVTRARQIYNARRQAKLGETVIEAQASTKTVLKGIGAVAAGAAVEQALPPPPPASRFSGQGPAPKQEIADHERKGLICIFGGHVSYYKKSGNRLFCPSPANTVNSRACRGSKFSPTFFCQSFGLSENKELGSESKKLCVPLRSNNGLDDLTVRCATAFEEFLPTVAAIDAAKLGEIQNALKEALNRIEQERGIHDIGLLDYCAQNNQINKERQKFECEALLKLLRHVETEIPSLSARAEIKKTQEPSVKAKPETKPATSRSENRNRTRKTPDNETPSVTPTPARDSGQNIQQIQPVPPPSGAR